MIFLHIIVFVSMRSYVIIDTLKTYPGEITLVTLGPLTNIATALLRAPEIASRFAALCDYGRCG